MEDKSVQQMQAAGARVVQSTPGLVDKLASTGKLGGRNAGGKQDDNHTVIMDLQRQLEAEKDKNRSLEDSYKFRVASFVKRETQTRNKIEALERRLNENPEADDHQTRMDVIRNMHHSVVSSLECIQNNTAKILQDQEKDLMRAFRNRLQEVSKEHEAQKNRKGEHSSELLAKHRRVVGELHEAQELAQTFDKKNQQLQAENQRLQEKLRTREDDRQALLKELVMARKEVARLRAHCKDGATAGAGEGPSKAPAEENAAAARKTFTQRQLEQARLQQTQNKQYEREMSYRDAITKLKRLVESERKTTRSLKQQQVEMLQQRTELEVLLRQCLDDVKAEVLRHRSHSPSPTSTAGAITGPGQAISTVNVNDLTAQDRERVLELLLSQQRVVQLLYSKTFSQPAPGSGPSGQSQPSPSPPPRSPPPKEDDLSWLSDIIPPGDQQEEE
mmetsp:Transcript_26321/g.52638  ORF Transcript_26321/g.52638 Transcript_26321/m.52638 type:complete len:445 (+) Transcript_26321:20-1354(+)